MSKGLDKLQDVGAQKIHENTHISRRHVQALLNGNFESLNKIQFLGFISILERDYEIKLDELKEDGLKYFDDKSSIEKEENEVFITPKKSKDYKSFYIIIVALIFIIAVFYSISDSSNSANAQVVDTKVADTQAVDNKVVDNVKNNTVIVEEVNSSIKKEDSEDSNISEIIPAETVSVKDIPAIEEPKALVNPSFKVLCQTKLWIGYVDMQTNKKFQKIFKGELELDPDTEWLISLGHGYVSFEINGELKEFNSKKTMRFIYKNAELTELNFKEFNRLNKGNEW